MANSDAVRGLPGLRHPSPSHRLPPRSPMLVKQECSQPRPEMNENPKLTLDTRASATWKALLRRARPSRLQQLQHQDGGAKNIGFDVHHVP
ncbi:Hypothetical protein NTJ_10859 [Nesidiocoris tenuis]|nr:Hypothetical protein NTJ_10859 [Nesidiocoris tenuis]